jgi:hypothetical protein
MTEEPAELATYRRLQALAESRVRGVADPAMDRALRRTRDAMIRELHKSIVAIESLPTAKNHELAREQSAKRASQVEYFRFAIIELGNTLQ